MTDIIDIKMNQPLSSVQLEKSLGISMDDIMKYSQLRDYTTIESLLPADGDYKILLLEEKIVIIIIKLFKIDLIFVFYYKKV
jgi:hypothetical protein